MDKMTEQMAIDMLNKGDARPSEVYFTYEEYCEAVKMGIQALEEIQQYRAIGTVQQCKEAVEKSQEMKLRPPTVGTFDYKGVCPVCGNYILLSENYCSKCGQKVGR